MDFDEKVLRIDQSEDTLSDISFAAPYSVNRIDEPSSVQVKQLLKDIRKNVWGCDLLLCFFIAALKSYRSDRCLRPFPSLYVNEEGKNFIALSETCDNIPPLNIVLMESNKCSQEVIKLLMWLFLERGQPVLQRISFDKVPFPSKFQNVFKPHFIFEICYPEKIETAWQKRQDGRELILAYHGSRVDNIYSILKVGLQQHFSIDKEVLFGNGIYLSSELSISTHYAPFSQTWINSSLGNKLSIITVCEIINDVNKVKCRDSKNKRRCINNDSLGEIPEKYFVVTDNDMVRVKYLMVYRERKFFSVKSYIGDHLFLCLLCFYFILIVVIGNFNSSSYQKIVKKFEQMFSFK